MRQCPRTLPNPLRLLASMMTVHSELVATAATLGTRGTYKTLRARLLQRGHAARGLLTKAGRAGGPNRQGQIYTRFSGMTSPFAGLVKGLLRRPNGQPGRALAGPKRHLGVGRGGWQASRAALALSCQRQPFTRFAGVGETVLGRSPRRSVLFINFHRHAQLHYLAHDFTDAFSILLLTQ
jgi:hypothetical protein